MVAIFDTNIVVDYLRGKKETVSKVEKYEAVYLPVTVCGELLFGASIAVNTINQHEKTSDFIGRSQILLADLSVAESYARIRKYLKEQGKPIPENDIWIAATALANDLKVITRDKHFLNVPFLDLEVWE